MSNKIYVKFTRALCRFYPELDTLYINAGDVREALNIIERHHPGIKDYLVDEQGALRRHVNIFVDGEMIEDRTALSDSLSGSKEIYIMQALSGG